MAETPTHCTFQHPGFAALGSPKFRLTLDDRIAALALKVEQADVIVPLSAVAKLFDIQADSADGRMLRLVEQGLRFVPTLSLGDRLPSEVLTGEASWEPREYHRQAATAKLQLQLVRWLGGSAETEDAALTMQMLIVAVDDPSIRPRVEEGLRRAATELGISGGGPAVSSLIGDLARELSYFEALREWLLDRASVMAKRLVRFAQDSPSLATGRRETLFQVVRLASTAATELAVQFEEVDGQTSNILSALRNLERQRTFLRPHRDLLYSTLLAWEPLLKAWESLPATLKREAEGIWPIIDDSYRFLAPRYMTVQAWQSVISPPDKSERVKTTHVW